ncbi:DUF5677 domain-containing protein [Streptomyces cavernicola]|uniref:Uncharacterized protein n=1 Tax=Streptomyces cavernicola TaxID=3043613 RepID=A0ABT6SHJ3_9ACTN|nr:DUF5677 domain-containing protein [Streptomyces sp. B-S-A6]MDI3407667.1 hypothetical protein [Streptomyces sp. B-S-A6]
MAYKFGPNEQCLRRTRRIVPMILAAAEETVENGVEVAVADMPMMPMLMGWWQFTNRTAAALTRLYDDGFSVEAAPLMRNLIGHAYAMNWLVDNGWPALRAIRAYSEEHRRKLAANIDATWNLTEPTPEIPATPLEFTDGADEKLHRKLMGELTNFDTLVKAYGTPEIYPVYRHHSAFCHTTAATASAFVVEEEDRLYFTTTPEGETVVEQIWIPVALLQAASAVSPYIKGHPMKRTIQKAMSDLGLPDTILNLKRGAVSTSSR